MRVEQLEQLRVQLSLDQALTESADCRLVRHCLVKAQPTEALEAQAVAQLRLCLRIAEVIEMLQDHHPNQHAHSMPRAAPQAVSRPDQPLGFLKAHLACNRLQHTIPTTTILRQYLKKAPLIARFAFHPHTLADPELKRYFFCRDL